MNDIFDNDGYPTEETLNRIKTETVTNSTFDEFMDFIKETFKYYGSFQNFDGIYRLATGGWSGNEDVIRALQENTVFWMCFHELTARGGLYIFCRSKDWERVKINIRRSK